MENIELPFKIYRREAIHFFVAWMALAFAFGNVLGSLNPLSVGVALMMSGVGFIAHELAHRYVARRHGFYARFKVDRRTLALVVITSFFDFVFAAPGELEFEGEPTEREEVLIDAAGPIISLILALFFFATMPGYFSLYGYRVNSWLAFFNMVPVAGLDGESIYRYDKHKFAMLFAVTLIVMMLRI